MARIKLITPVLLTMFLFLGFSSNLFAQSQDEKVMTITIETVDKNDLKQIKKLKFMGEEADESRVDEIVDEYLTGEEKRVNVNVEIEANSDSDTDEIHINGKKIDVKVDGDKVYINGEEVEEGTYDDKTVRILRMDDIDSDEVKDALKELNIEDFDGNEIMFIETEIETEEDIQEGKGFLGIYKSHSENDAEGVVVGKVTEDFPAAKAGIQEGDVILKFNGTSTNSFAELAKLIGAEKPGNTVDITYARNGVSKTVEATLIDRPNRRQAFTERRFRFKDAEGNEKDYSKEDAFMRGLDRNGSCDKRRSKCCEPKPGCCDTDQDCCKRNSSSNNKARLGVGIAEGQGARVISVDKNTAAAKAGMLVGDDIIKLDKNSIGSVEELIEAMSSYEPGDQVKVTYLRKGKKIKTKVVLEKTEISCCAPNGKRSKKIEKQRIIIKKNKEDKDMGEAEMQYKNDLKIDELDVYPNPTSSEMNFKFKLGKKAPTEFKIVDITGQEVFSDKIENFSGTYETVFDFSNLIEGMYFFQIDQKGKKFTEKIMYSKD